MNNPRVQITLDVDGEINPDDPEDWCDFNADVKLLLERREAARLIAKLAEFIANTEDGDAVLEFELGGRAYMTGRLPDRATFTEDGTERPGIVICDDIHEWTFPSEQGGDGDG